MVPGCWSLSLLTINDTIHVVFLLVSNHDICACLPLDTLNFTLESKALYESINVDSKLGVNM